MIFYTVTAKRFSTEHQYVVGVFSSEEKAFKAAKKENEDRAGKYNEFFIHAWEVDKTPNLYPATTRIVFPDPWGDLPENSDTLSVTSPDKE